MTGLYAMQYSFRWQFRGEGVENDLRRRTDSETETSKPKGAEGHVAKPTLAERFRRFRDFPIPNFVSTPTLRT